MQYMFKLYRQIFTAVSVVSLRHVADVPTLSDFVPKSWESLPYLCSQPLLLSVARLYHAKIIILWRDIWYWIFPERKWAIATNNTAHAPHLHTPPWWLAGFLSSSVRVECHLAAWMKTWGKDANFETYMTKLLLLFQRLCTADFFV